MGNGDLVESKGQGTMAVQTKKVMAATVNDSTLWHQRFGHYNYNALRLLHQKEQVTRPSITIPEENFVDNQNIAEERIPEVIEEEELSSPERTPARMRPLSEVYESFEASGEIQLKFCSSEEQLADIFTKALPRDKFQFLRDMLGVTGKHIKEEY
ncbi:hypothetical protein EZV62_012507 [Acer yangbiense]|uniref:Uncharacterized protein n=1 Tax=Acer yangbiense TaxID=1000413 RepID=A0A5C7HWF7_9ROSI|nr:hypothetical protein EZV62_012507 [Acer yangbiense]